ANAPSRASRTSLLKSEALDTSFIARSLPQCSTQSSQTETRGPSGEISDVVAPGPRARAPKPDGFELALLDELADCLRMNAVGSRTALDPESKPPPSRRAIEWGQRQPASALWPPRALAMVSAIITLPHRTQFSRVRRACAVVRTRGCSASHACRSSRK